MKKLHTGLMSAAALLIAAAAVAAPQGTSGSAGTSGGQSSTMSGSGSSGGATGSGSSMRDGASRGDSGSQAQLSSADKKWVMEAASAGMFEVQAAQLAQTKAQDPANRQYAQAMIREHQPNNQQLMQIAQQKGVTPPTKLEAKHQAMLTKLEKADAEEFDETYGKLMEQSHADTHKLMERGQKQVKDADLQAYIAQTTPVIVKHHSQAMQLPGAEGKTRQATADSPSMGGSSMGGSSSSGSMGGSSMGGSSSSGSMGGSSSSSSQTTPPEGSASSRTDRASNAASDTETTGRP